MISAVSSVAPLGSSSPRPETETSFSAGATLVLYTDGLIERRGEDIDTGLARLINTLARHHGSRPRYARRRSPPRDALAHTPAP